MCPAGDNRWHWKAMQESFYMTNICPQNHNLNRGDWKELEEACRLWAKKEGKIYIVCGPVLYRQKHRTIGKKHKITVPEAFFKVILCTNSNPPKAIGFIYKNTSGNHPLDTYVNSVDEVERITETGEKSFFAEIKDRFGDSLYQVGRGIRSFVIGFLGSLPIIFVWVVIAAVVVIVVRSIRKKRKKKKE